jgi:Transposase DNA-binding/Transposase DDE domain
MITNCLRPRFISLLGDARLDRRLDRLVSSLSQDIGKGLSYCLLKCSQIKAAYRFFDNKKVTHHHLMATSQEKLIHHLIAQDMLAYSTGHRRVVLHIQDTTTLNFSRQKSARQLPCLNYLHHRGYFAHTSLVTDVQGCIEGILDQPLWGRSESDLGTSVAFQSVQKSLPIESKESDRWVSQFALFQSVIGELSHTHGISISDSESDIFELFIAKQRSNVDLIVRSHHNRQLIAPTHAPQTLNAYLLDLPVQGNYWLEVLNDDKHSYRLVNLAVRFGEVAIKLPENLKWSSSVPRAARRLEEKMAAKKGLILRVVEVKEINPTPGIKPIHWTLLTTLPINDFWDALQTIQYYTIRWRIEIFHLVLKEGCAIEKLQLEKPERVQNAIAVYSTVAAKLTALRYLAQTQGQKPMDITGFTQKQYHFLNQYLKTNYAILLPKPQADAEIPTVEQFMQVVNCLGGGHKGNKSKKIGIRQLWKGFSVVKIILNAYKAFAEFDSA